MAFLAGVVVLVGVVSVINLILLYGVIRRLRDHEQRISGGPTTDAMLPVGREPREFEPQQATDGSSITRESLAGSHVAFFSPGCEPCKEQAPLFAKLATKLPRDRVMVVTAGSPTETAGLATLFEPVARVVREPLGTGPMQVAFGVEAFPALGVLDETGRLVASVSTTELLPDALPA